MRITQIFTHHQPGRAAAEYTIMQAMYTTSSAFLTFSPFKRACHFIICQNVTIFLKEAKLAAASDPILIFPALDVMGIPLRTVSHIN
jgi:hypothetical protein